ncbi:MAG: ABC transporter permease [Xanthomonadaceae bacterium]|nr:ABC transporter permease [Xanthomonadaceae bacterium]
MLKRILAIFNTRNKEFYRDTAALAWSFAFPFLVVIGFWFAFSKGSQNQFKVGVVSTSQTATLTAFKKIDYIEFVDIPNENRESINLAIGKLKRHQYDMIVESNSGNSIQYWINSSSPKGYLVEKFLLGSRASNDKISQQKVEGKEIRYVDWLIAGMIAMNLMFGAFFGVGYTIVRYRKSGVLKRLKATPLTPFEFLLAQVFSRMVVMMGISSIVFVGTHLIVHFQMLGSYLDLFLVTALGSFCLICMSLVVAARISSEEFANGLLNLLSWPMMFLSGVWFSLEGADPMVKKFSQIFPLTHVIDASRAIMTEGATLSMVSYNLVTLAIMSAVFLLIGAILFRWE